MENVDISARIHDRFLDPIIHVPADHRTVTGKVSGHGQPAFGQVVMNAQSLARQCRRQVFDAPGRDQFVIRRPPHRQVARLAGLVKIDQELFAEVFHRGLEVFQCRQGVLSRLLEILQRIFPGGDLRFQVRAQPGQIGFSQRAILPLLVPVRHLDADEHPDHDDQELHEEREPVAPAQRFCHTPENHRSARISLFCSSIAPLEPAAVSIETPGAAWRSPK